MALAGEEARQQDVAFMSAAFFGDVQVFMPHVTSEDRLGFWRMSCGCVGMCRINPNVWW